MYLRHISVAPIEAGTMSTVPPSGAYPWYGIEMVSAQVNATWVYHVQNPKATHVECTERP